jgi:hypothetical protein
MALSLKVLNGTYAFGGKAWGFRRKYSSTINIISSQLTISAGFFSSAR